MAQPEQGIEIGKYMNDAQEAALTACKTTYKANRNPAVAALYDRDPSVRAGASILLAGLCKTKGIVTPNTLPVLKLAIKGEKNKLAKLVMEAMYARIAAE